MTATQSDIFKTKNSEKKPASLGWSFAYADLGNSRFKILIGDKFAAFEYLQGWEQRAIEFIILNSESKVLLIIASVNDSGKNQLFTALSHKTHFLYTTGLNSSEPFKDVFKPQNNKFSLEKTIHAYDAEDLLKTQKVFKYNHIKGMGIDRAIGLLGAVSKTKPPLITVDCGTATTINAIDGKYKCLGGAIYAGIYTQLSALANNTSALKEQEMKYIKNAAGKNTGDALRSGIITGTAGAVNEIIRKIEIQEFEGKHVKVILTGGCAFLIKKALKEAGVNFVHRPYLVLEGIKKLTDLVMS